MKEHKKQILDDRVFILTFGSGPLVEMGYIETTSASSSN